MPQKAKGSPFYYYYYYCYHYAKEAGGPKNIHMPGRCLADANVDADADDNADVLMRCRLVRCPMPKVFRFGSIWSDFPAIWLTVSTAPLGLMFNNTRNEAA